MSLFLTMKPLTQLCLLIKLSHWKSVSNPIIYLICLCCTYTVANCHEHNNCCCIIEGCCYKRPPQSNDAVFPVVDEYLGLKSAPKILEKISQRPKNFCISDNEKETQSQMKFLLLHLSKSD